MAWFWGESGMQLGVVICVITAPPAAVTYMSEVGSELVWVEGVALLTLGPHPIPPSYLLPTLLHPSPSALQPHPGTHEGRGVAKWASCSVVFEWRRGPIGLSHLAEFQTPIIFDCGWDFDHCTFYGPPKIL
jgi:hypothetical protein